MAKKLDPRTKVLLALLINIPVFVFNDALFTSIFMAYGMVLLLFNRSYKSVRNILIVIIIITTYKYYVEYVPNILMLIFGSLVVSLRLFLPFVIYAQLLIKTTSISEMATVLDQMKTPTSIVIPLLVMFRYFPTIKDERKSIRNAMKLKGINFNIFNFLLHPIRTVEYLYVPLLFSLVNSGEDLTVAALTRGLGDDKTRTHLKHIKPTILDFLVLLGFIAILLSEIIAILRIYKSDNLNMYYEYF